MKVPKKKAINVDVTMMASLVIYSYLAKWVVFLRKVGPYRVAPLMALANNFS